MSNKFTYTIDLNANIGDLESKFSTIKQMFSRLTESGKYPEISQVFDKIGKSLDNLKTKGAQPIVSSSQFTSMAKDASGVGTQLNNLVSIIQDLVKSADGEILDFLPANIVQDINAAIGAIQNYSTAMDGSIKKSKELTAAEQEQAKIESDLAKKKAKAAELSGSIDTSKAELEQTKVAQTEANKRIEIRRKELDQAKKELEELEAEYKSSGTDPKSTLTRKDGTSASLSDAQNKVKNAEQAVGDAEFDASAIESEISSLEKAVNNFTNNLVKVRGEIGGLEQSLEKAKVKVSGLTAEFESGKTEQQKQAFENLKKSAESLGISLEGISPDGTTSDIELLTNRLQELSANGIQQAENAANSCISSVQQMGNSVEQTSQAVDQGAQAFDNFNQQMNSLESIKSSIAQFLSITGVARMASQAFRDAFEAVKDLDAAMTEMAVVTELDVGDYWDQIPEYTARANELGVSIKSAYEAATLFYQQGLDTNEVVALSNQTLKMARIAGLDAAEATDRMTAALRGFNMELNEASAQKVADVYSQLAAITASDVDEISTAMTKTASIASSAGMEFETTAAFLSQIIETTRESAETAGTAMKTVIARFQELQKDPAEIGEVDGEIIDANKIETALRSVGVALRDSSGQFRDLDDVFLELASKWEGLDKNTQRYIATIAAGSRQQSRFIAMMSDYGRTQELVGEAQNSAGAANKQYEKTLESMESKLARLDNAWTTFTTGVMDSGLTKFFVDLLTNLLSGINGATEGVDFLGEKMKGVTEVFSKIGMVIGIFNIVKAAISKFFQWIASTFASSGTSMGQNFVTAIKQGLGQAEGVVTEFVDNTNGKVSNTGKTAPTDNSSTSNVQPVEGAAPNKATEVVPPQATAPTFKETMGNTFKSVGKAIISPYSKAFEGGAEMKSAKQEKQAAIGEYNAAREDQIKQAEVSHAISQVDDGTSLAEGLNVQKGQVSGQSIGDYDAKYLPMDDIKEGFVSSFKDSEKGNAAWDGISQEIQQGGKKISEVLNTIDQALEKNAADLKDNDMSGGKEGGKTDSTPDAEGGEEAAPGKNKGKKMGRKKKKAAKKKNQKTEPDASITDPKKTKAKVKKNTQIQEGAEKSTQKAQETTKKKQEEMYAAAQKAQEKSMAGYKKVASGITNVGTTASMAGVGLGMMGSALTDMGLNEAGEALTKVGNVMTSVGGIISIFGTIMSALTPIINKVTQSQVKQAASAGVSAAASGADTAAKGAQTAANIGLAGAETTATVAAGPFAAIMLVILIIVIALVAIIIVLVMLFNSIETPEKQLQSAAENLALAGEAADLAAEKFDKLKESLDELDKKYDAMEGLVQGTKEWDEAVEDVNNSVLDLITKYPELASLVTKENGVLKLDVDSQAVKDVIDKYGDNAKATKGAEYQAQMAYAKAQQSMNRKTTMGSTLTTQTGNYSTAIGGYTKDGYYRSLDSTAGDTGEKIGDQIARAVANGEITINQATGEIDYNEQDLSKYGMDAETLNLFNDTIVKNIESFRALGQQMATTAAQTELLGEAATEAAIAAIDNGQYTKEEIKQMQTVADNDWMQQYVKEAEDEASGAYTDASNGETEEARKDRIAQSYGEGAYWDGETLHYKDADGKDATKEFTGDQIDAQFKMLDAQDRAEKAMRLIPGAIDELGKNLSKEDKKTYESIFNNDGGAAMSREQAEAASKFAESGKITEEAFNKLRDDQQKALGGSFEKYQELIQKTADSAIGTFKSVFELEQDITKQLQESGTLASGEEFKLDTSLSGSISSALAKNFGQIMAHSGAEAVKDANDKLQALTKDLTQSQKDSFYNTINAIDWSKAEEWDAIPDMLYEMGISLPDAELQEFIDYAKETGRAVKNINLETLLEQIKSISGVIKDIESGDQTRNFDESQYQAIIAMDPELAKQFSMNYDGSYDFIGSSLDVLNQALRENTQATLDEARIQMQTKIKTADLIDAMDGQQIGEDVLNLEARGEWSDLNKKDYVSAFIESMKASGLDIAQLGIAGLGNNTNAYNLSSTQLDDILSEITTIKSSRLENTKQMGGIMKQIKGLTYKSQSFSDNSAANKNLRAQGFLTKQNQDENGNMTWTINQDAMEEMQARMEAMFSDAVKYGVDEETLQHYSDLMLSLEEIEPEIDANGQITGVYAEWLNTASELEGKMQQVVEAQQAIQESAEKVRTEYTYLNTLSEAISARDAAASTKQTAFERFKNKGKISEDGVERDLTSADVANYITDQVGTIQGNIQRTGQSLTKKGNTIYDRLTNEDYEKFSKFVAFNPENGEMVVDQKGAEEAFANDEEGMQAFDTFIGELYDLSNGYREDLDSLEEYADSLEEYLDSGKEEYSDLLSQVYDAILSEKQELVDNLSQIDESVNRANETVTGKIQEQLDEERQERANREAKENLANNYDRLAMLQRDTSGGNLTEIQNLEQNIEQEEQSLSDSLMDQSLAQMVADNQEASLQRQRQIEIAQAQVDLASQSQATWQLATEMLAEGLRSDNFMASEVGQLLQKADGFNAMSPEEQQNWQQSLTTSAAMAGAYKINGEEIQRQINTAKSEIATAQKNGAEAIVQNGEVLLGGLADAEYMKELTNTSTDKIYDPLDLLWQKFSGVYSGAEDSEVSQWAELKDAQDALAKAITDNNSYQLLRQSKESMSTTFKSKRDFEADAAQFADNPSMAAAVNGGHTDFDSYVKSQASSGRKKASEQPQITTEEDFAKKVQEAYDAGWREDEDGTKYNIYGDDEEAGKKNAGIVNYGTDDFEQYTENYRFDHPEIAAAELEKKTAEEYKKGRDTAVTNAANSIIGNGLKGKTILDFESFPAYKSQRTIYEENQGKQVDFKGAVLSKLRSSKDFAFYLGKATDASNGWSTPSVTIDGTSYTFSTYEDEWWAWGGWQGYEKHRETDNKIIGRLTKAANGTPEHAVVYDAPTDTIYAAIKNRDNDTTYWQNIKTNSEGGTDQKYVNLRNATRKWLQYKTGGLADFTGPAWLDGTPSKPEYILNADQTARFFQLIDVLDGFDKNQSSEKSGDNYFEIEINVDSISSDYDVEQMAEKIKNIIYEDSMYRNVNAINHIR